MVELACPYASTFKLFHLIKNALNIDLVTVQMSQMSLLDDWGFWDRDHSNSLSGFIQSLKSSILRLPLTSGAKVILK